MGVLRKIMVMTIGKINITKKLVYKIIVILAVSALVLGVATYIFLIQREKQQFAQAEKEIDALYAQIVKKVGKPDQEKKTKTCDRPNMKYSKGNLSCSVNTYLLYEDVDTQEANVNLAEISTLGNESLRVGSAAAKGSNFTDSTRKDWDQTFFQHFRSKTPMSCNFSYTHPAIEQDEFKIKSTNALMIGIDCYRSALGEYFPVKD